VKTFSIIPLPQNRWKTCDGCKGTGYQFDGGDTHRSAGYIPCKRIGCIDGIIKYKHVLKDEKMTKKKSYDYVVCVKITSDVKLTKTQIKESLQKELEYFDPIMPSGIPARVEGADFLIKVQSINTE
jgi:hypothetical protein